MGLGGRRQPSGVLVLTRNRWRWARTHRKSTRTKPHRKLQNAPACALAADGGTCGGLERQLPTAEFTAGSEGVFQVLNLAVFEAIFLSIAKNRWFLLDLFFYPPQEGFLRRILQ